MAAAERSDLVTMKGDPITLLGPALNVGDAAPEFQVVDAAFQPVRLADFAGHPILISAVPSLDTGLCASQTKRFDEEIARLPSEVVVLTISMDLPFAQKRFYESEKIDRIRVLSDHVWRQFGERYGILIKGMGLLSRAVFVLGRDQRIQYLEIVSEVGTEPDYAAALSALRAAAS